MSYNLPPGWTPDKIEESLSFQRKFLNVFPGQNKKCKHGHDKAWDAGCNLCTPDDYCVRTAEDDCPLEDEIMEEEKPIHESIPKCGNCEEFADKCTCWDNSDDGFLIIAWRIKHGHIESDVLKAKVKPTGAANCAKHNRLIVALLDPDTKKEKGYCTECIRELEEDLIEAPDCDNCDEKQGDPPDHSWRD